MGFPDHDRYRCSQTGATPSVPATQLQALLDQAVSDAGIPGAIMAVQTSAGTWIGASGKADLAANLAMTTDMQVHLAGVTKLFTAALTMKLVEENKLTLDDTVDKWLPFTVINGDAINVDMLLNHTSGLHDHETTPEFVDSLLWGPTLPWTNDDIFWIIDSYLPDFDPGTDYQFCNTDYYILGMVAEAALQGTVENAIQARFFDPLGMTHTALTRGGFKDHPLPPGLLLFRSSRIPRPIDISDWDLAWDWTSGSGVSTAQDMLTWTKAFFGGKVVNRTVPAADDHPPGPRYGLRLRAGGFQLRPLVRGKNVRPQFRQPGGPHPLALLSELGAHHLHRFQPLRQTVRRRYSHGSSPGGRLSSGG